MSTKYDDAHLVHSSYSNKTSFMINYTTFINDFDNN